MYRFLLLSLLFPAQLFAQSYVRPKLNHQQCYEKALSEFIKTHPGSMVRIKSGNVLFVKKQRFIHDFTDSTTGVQVKAIDIDSSAGLLAQYFPKKQKFIYLDLNPMTVRELNGHIWIMPMKVSFNSKKGIVDELKYTDELCEYLFDFTPDKEQYYLYRQGSCKEVD